MNNKLFNYRIIRNVLIIVTVFITPIFLYLHYYNEILYHITSEFSIVIIGVIASLIGILTNSKSKNNILSRVSPAILFYSILMFAHNLSYPGMNIFTNQSHYISLHLKTIANLILALGVLSAVLDRHGKFKINVTFVLTLIGALALTVLTFLEVLPVFIINDRFTTIKIIVEIFIILLYLLSIIFFYINYKRKFYTRFGIFISIIIFILISETFSLMFFSISSYLINFDILFRYLGFIILLYIVIKINLLIPYNELFLSLLNDKENEVKLKNEISDNYRRLTKSQEVGHVGTWELDIKTRKIWATKEAFKIYGLEIPDNQLVDLSYIQNIVIPEDRHILDLALSDLINKNKPYDVTYSITDNKGNFHHIHSIANLTYDDDAKPIIVSGVLQDITKLKEEQDKLLYASTHDHLTGLYNRRYFSQMREIFDAKVYLPTSVIILDINGLKVINDSFGHHAGNQVLKKLSVILAESVNNTLNFASRIGGDEFAIIMPNTSFDEADKFMNAVLERINSERVGNINLSIAYGISSRTKLNYPIDEVLKNAEDEMYLFKLSDSQSVRNKIIDALLKTLYEKDNGSEEHSQRVSDYAYNLAIACKLSNKKANDIKTAGLLHDIGKITISNEILNKAGKLTNEEYEIVKTHSKKGYSIVHSIGDMDIIANYVYQHHEFYNGKGYPNGLSKDDISFESRIISLADSYDAMTSYRDYKDQLNEAEAIKELKRCSGTQFDPELVNVFIKEVLPLYK